MKKIFLILFLLIATNQVAQCQNTKYLLSYRNNKDSWDWIGKDYLKTRWKLLNDNRYDEVTFKNRENSELSLISFTEKNSKNQPKFQLEFKNDTCIKVRVEFPINLYNEYLNILNNGYTKISNDAWGDYEH